MLKVSNINKNYGNFQALYNVSFILNKSSIIGLIGANGAGKTTIIKNIVKLQNPDSGIITYNDENINSINIYPIGYIPDTPVYFEELTVYENFLFVCKLYRKPEKHIFELCSNFKMSDYLYKLPSQLSKGNQQKIMLIISLLKGFELLVADEPFNGLDPEQIIEFKNLLINFKNSGKTILISTHMLDLAETICDDFVFIEEGHIIASGTKEDLSNLLDKSNNCSLEEIFISVVRNGR